MRLCSSLVTVVCLCARVCLCGCGCVDVVTAVTTWDAMPSVFPHGLDYFYNKTGWPIQVNLSWPVTL